MSCNSVLVSWENGVPYFHLRVCNKPKYYFDNELSKE